MKSETENQELNLKLKDAQYKLELALSQMDELNMQVTQLHEDQELVA